MRRQSRTAHQSARSGYTVSGTAKYCMKRLIGDEPDRQYPIEYPPYLVSCDRRSRLLRRSSSVARESTHRECPLLGIRWVNQFSAASKLRDPPRQVSDVLDRQHVLFFA